jgi:hypothetical protein
MVSFGVNLQRITSEAIVYDYGALSLTYTVVRVILFLAAATFWILYFREIFRSGGIRTRWLKQGLANLLLIVSIALVTFLVFSFMSGFVFTPHRHR